MASQVDQIRDWNQKDLRVCAVLRAKLSMRLAKIKDDVTDPNDGLKELYEIAMTALAIQRQARLALGMPTDHMGVGGVDPKNAPTLADFYAAVRGGAPDADESDDDK